MTSYQLCLQIDFEKIGLSRACVMAKLHEGGARTQVHYIPVYTQPFYSQRFNTKWGDCPRAELYYKKCLSIPLFPAMSDEDVKKVIKCVKSLDHINER